MSTWRITIIKDSPSSEQLQSQVNTRQKADLDIFPDSLQSYICVISVLRNGSQTEKRRRQHQHQQQGSHHQDDPPPSSPQPDLALLPAGPHRPRLRLSVQRLPGPLPFRTVRSLEVRIVGISSLMLCQTRTIHRVTHCSLMLCQTRTRL